MLRFLSARLWNGLLVMIGVSFISFLIFNYIGDPVNNLLGETATGAQKEAMRTALGLDQPLVLRFLSYMRLALSGEFGISYRNLEPVGQLLLARVPATLELSLCAAVLALGVGIPMGVYAGIRRNSWLAQTMQVVSLVGVSIPSFLTGIILILAPIFFPIATQLGIDPIHLGIIMVVNMEIGLITPPVGLNLFVTSAVTGMPLTAVVKAAWPWLMLLLSFLIVITYVPSISLALPNWLGMT